MLLFERRIEVDFVGVNVHIPDGVRIQFEVDKHDSKRFNHGVIRIFNLDQNDRLVLARTFPIGKPLVDPVITAFLKVGYEDTDVVQILSGDVLSVINERRGPDWITHVEVFTGLNIGTKSTTEISFAEPTSARVIIDTLVANMGLDVRFTDEALAAISGQTLDNYSATGLTYNELDLFIRRYGLDFTIEENDRGLIYITDRPRDPGEPPTDANTFSTFNGLLGAPIVTRSGIAIRALLRPEFKLMQKFYVEAETLKRSLRNPSIESEYYCTDIVHAGDNRGETWFTDLVGVYTAVFDESYQSA